MSDYTTLKQLAVEFGIDKSNIRKYILARGIVPTKMRDHESRQLILVVSDDEADAIRQARDEEGYTNRGVTVESSKGYFYIIQIIPEFDPCRVKLGFANNVQVRLQAHRTSAPTAVLVASWPCDRAWEPVAITSITRVGCTHLLNEVYTCDSVENITARADEFFAIMPKG